MQEHVWLRARLEAHSPNVYLQNFSLFPSYHNISIIDRPPRGQEEERTRSCEKKEKFEKQDRILIKPFKAS